MALFGHLRGWHISSLDRSYNTPVFISNAHRLMKFLSFKRCFKILYIESQKYSYHRPPTIANIENDPSYNISFETLIKNVILLNFEVYIVKEYQSSKVSDRKSTNIFLIHCHIFIKTEFFILCLAVAKCFLLVEK